MLLFFCASNSYTTYYTAKVSEKVSEGSGGDGALSEGDSRGDGALSEGGSRGEELAGNEE